MYEVVIRNGYIYDGLGSNPYIADIAILNGIIVAIGKIEDEALNVCLLYTSPSPRDS